MIIQPVVICLQTAILLFVDIIKRLVKYPQTAILLFVDKYLA